jgi:hypothetical protein
MANGWYRKTTDVVIPGFHERSAAGEIFNNPYTTKYVEEIGIVEGTWQQTAKDSACSPSYPYKHLKTIYAGTGFVRAKDLFGADGQPTSNLSVLAGTDAASGVQAANVQGLVELAELAKTLKFIANPFKAFENFIEDILRSKDFRRWKANRLARGKSTSGRKPGKGTAATLADYLSEEWLRYRYGIMPLFYLCNDALKAVNEPKAPVRRTSRGKATETRVLQENVNEGDPTVEVRAVNRTHTKTWTVRAGVLYEHSLDLQANYGTRFQDVPEAAWELIQFSFIVDWFLNVGSFLGAIRPKVGVKQLATWTTTTLTDNREVTMVCTGGSGSSTYEYTSDRFAHSSIKTVEKRRVPGISVGLTYKWTTIDNFKSIHLKRATDSVALIYKLLRR